MPRLSRTELEAENAELYGRLEQIRDNLAGLFDNDPDEDGDDIEADEDDE